MIRRWRPRAMPTTAAGWTSADRFYWLAALIAHHRPGWPAEAIGCPVAWLRVADSNPLTAPRVCA